MSRTGRCYYEFGPFRLDPDTRLLLRDGKALPLPPKPFDMLLALVQHRGEVLDKDRLLEMLWPDSIVEEANLPQNISALRKVLGESPSERRYILTVPGHGYRFAAEVKEVEAEPSDPNAERPVAASPIRGTRQNWRRWDGRKSGRCKRAVDLNPNSRDVHRAYALLYFYLGRYGEALEEIRRAKELDLVSTT